MWEFIGTFFHSLDGFTYHVRIIKTKSKVYLQKCMCYYKSKPEQAKCPWNHGELNVTYMWSDLNPLTPERELYPNFLYNIITGSLCKVTRIKEMVTN